MNTNNLRYSVVIGGTNTDIFIRAQNYQFSDDSTPGDIAQSPGGVARNIAETLANLGQGVSLISIVGDDAPGRTLRQVCSQAGVSTQHLFVSSRYPTGSYASFIQADGTCVMAVNDMKIIVDLTTNKLASANDTIAKSSLLVLDTNLSEDVLAYLFDRYRGKPIVVDPVSICKAGKIHQYLPWVDTIKCNQHEAEKLTGIRIQKCSDAKQVADELHHQGVKHVLVSMGKYGAYASTENEQWHVPAKTQHVINATGAGDTCVAGLVYGRMNEWPWSRTVHYSLALSRQNLCAASSVTPQIAN